MSEGKRSKVLTAARSVFLRFGYRRVSMNEIAEAAGISRAALYLTFKNKEDVFIGVFQQWVDETLTEISHEMAQAATAHEKLSRAFELWSVRPFAMTMESAEAKELVECSFGFAEPALRQGFQRLEAILVPVLASDVGPRLVEPENIAHVLASAVSGFKQAATTPDELRRLIADLLTLAL